MFYAITYVNIIITYDYNTFVFWHIIALILIITHGYESIIMYYYKFIITYYYVITTSSLHHHYVVITMVEICNNEFIITHF